MPIKKPTNTDPRFWAANAPKGIVIDPKIEVYLAFIHKHIEAYAKRDHKSKDEAVMRNRINDIRQMSAGLKKSADSINAALKNPKNKKIKDAEPFLMQYLEVLRAVERDRHKVMATEKAAGNTKAIDEIAKDAGVIKI